MVNASNKGVKKWDEVSSVSVSYQSLIKPKFSDMDKGS